MRGQLGLERQDHENKKKFDLFFCCLCIRIPVLPAPAAIPVDACRQPVCSQPADGGFAASGIHRGLAGLAIVLLSACQIFQGSAEKAHSPEPTAARPPGTAHPPRFGQSGAYQQSVQDADSHAVEQSESCIRFSLPRHRVPDRAASPGDSRVPSARSGCGSHRCRSRSVRVGCCAVRFRRLARAGPA
ncbi:hypothetical protein D3C85_673520 [compost metagenome]